MSKVLWYVSNWKSQTICNPSHSKFHQVQTCFHDVPSCASRVSTSLSTCICGIMHIDFFLRLICITQWISQIRTSCFCLIQSEMSLSDNSSCHAFLHFWEIDKPVIILLTSNRLTWFPTPYFLQFSFEWHNLINRNQLKSKHFVTNLYYFFVNNHNPALRNKSRFPQRKFWGKFKDL